MDDFDKLVAELTEIPSESSKESKSSAGKPDEALNTSDGLVESCESNHSNREQDLDEILKELVNGSDTQEAQKAQETKESQDSEKVQETQINQTLDDALKDLTNDLDYQVPQTSSQESQENQTLDDALNDLLNSSDYQKSQNTQSDSEPFGTQEPEKVQEAQTLDELLEGLKNESSFQDIFPEPTPKSEIDLTQFSEKPITEELDDRPRYITTPDGRLYGGYTSNPEDEVIPHPREAEDRYAWAKDLPGFENIYEQLTRNAKGIHDPEEQAKKIKEMREYIGPETDIFFDEEGHVNIKPKMTDMEKFPPPDYTGNIDHHNDIFDIENPLKDRPGALSNYDPGEVADAENKFIDFLLYYENELKTIKNIFKLKTLEFQARGVNTTAVTAAVKKIARDAKKDPMTLSNEETTLERLSCNKELVEKIKSVLV